MSCSNPRCCLVPPKGSPIFLGYDEPRGTIFHPEYGLCRVVYLPCGNCLQCRIERRQDLTALQLLEATMHKDVWFLTLTYDDWKTYELTGEVPYSLVRQHLSEFVGNMRHFCSYRGEEFRFFACGEYGDHTHRPHYHMTVFGVSADCLRLPTDDLGASDRYRRLSINSRFVSAPAPSSDFNGNPFWQSPVISKYWQFGHHMLYRANKDTMQYVAGYVTKKLTGDKAKDRRSLGLDDEFTMQSRPSIGYPWFIRNYGQLSKIDSIHQKLISDNIEIPSFSWRIPRIFDKWLLRIDQFDAVEVLNRIKFIRQLDAPLVPDREELLQKADFAKYKADKYKYTKAKRGKL